MKFRVLITEKDIAVNGVKSKSLRLSPTFEHRALILALDRIQKRLDEISSPLKKDKISK